MLKRFSLLAALLVAFPAVAQDAAPMAEAAKLVPPDFTQLYVDPSLGEIWGKAGAAREEPRLCVVDGKVACIMYGLKADRLAAKDSYYNFYGLEGLPPVTNMEVLFHAQDASTPFDTYEIVLLFTGYPK